MSGCGWCGMTEAVPVFEVLHEVRGSATDRWLDVCAGCVAAAREDGERDPEVVNVQVEAITTVPATAVAA